MHAYNGFKKFKEEKLPSMKEELDQLKNGQSPKILFITCSDSRICPNELTQTKQGELFVIRNAGNTIPHFDEGKTTSDAATLEYAVEVLGVEEIVVCGHSHCGAMGALMGGVGTEFKMIPSYLDRLVPLKKELEGMDANVDTFIEKNVGYQIRNIRSYPFVQQALQKGLKIYGWVYSIETGDVNVTEEV